MNPNLKIVSEFKSLILFNNMKKLFSGIGSKYLNLKLILIPLLIFNTIIYISGSFISWDMNPKNWLLVNTILGRIGLVALELYIFLNIPKFWSGWNKHK